MKYTIAHAESLDTPLARTVTIDEAVHRARLVAKKGTPFVIVVWNHDEKGARQIRAIAENGSVAWARACPRCQGSNAWCYTCNNLRAVRA